MKLYKVTFSIPKGGCIYDTYQGLMIAARSKSEVWEKLHDKEFLNKAKIYYLWEGLLKSRKATIIEEIDLNSLSEPTILLKDYCQG